MKVNFRNKAARLNFSSSHLTCKRCPFYEAKPCPFKTSIIVDCDNKGWWVDGESLDIFKV